MKLSIDESPRPMRRQLCALLAGLAVHFAPTLVSAQSVTAISGSTVTLSAGAKQGVAKGMTGVLYVVDDVAGQKMEVKAARFEVTAVADGSTAARITAGDAGAVSVGHRARFDQPLQPPAATTAAPAAKPAPPAQARAATAEELLAAGNRLYDAQDCAGAAAKFRELENRFPQHSEAGYAAKLAATCEQRAAAAHAETERAVRAATASAGADEIANRSRLLLGAGQLDEAGSEARRALDLDPKNEVAVAVQRELKQFEFGYVVVCQPPLGVTTSCEAYVDGERIANFGGNNYGTHVTSKQCHWSKVKPGQHDVVLRCEDKNFFGKPESNLHAIVTNGGSVVVDFGVWADFKLKMRAWMVEERDFKEFLRGVEGLPGDVLRGIATSSQ
ncbi:MAG: hypothetical protein KBI44_11355 [Thermoanaerobaculia bacterium]|nr:hypothetical protein [Thermoanaerobaculia bacterium]